MFVKNLLQLVSLHSYMVKYFLVVRAYLQPPIFTLKLWLQRLQKHQLCAY